jgi:alpha-beta hydrolase superfamily lysophospholipase
VRRLRRLLIAALLLAGAAGPLAGCSAVPSEPAAEPPTRAFEPTGVPRGRIVALHGFGDHKGAFEGLGRWLAERGFGLVAYDQRGFGEQRDRMFWPGTEALVAQARQVVEAERARHPDLPLWLLGDSMGAAVALLAASGPEAVPVDGLILVAPAVWGGETMPRFYRATMRALATLFPWLRVSGRGLPVRPAEDLEVVRALARDPLHLGEPRADAVVGLLELMDAARAAGPLVRVPTLLLVPGRDDIVPTAVQLSFAPTIAAAECRLVLYPTGRHLLLRDRDRLLAWHDLLAWLERRTPPSGLARPCRAPDPSGRRRRPHRVGSRGPRRSVRRGCVLPQPSAISAIVATSQSSASARAPVSATNSCPRATTRQRPSDHRSAERW